MRAILIVCIALLFCYGCKSRQVAIKHVDSTSVHSTVTQSNQVTTHKDTGTTVTKIKTVTSDSTETETDITPLPGKPITINKDGSFSGEVATVHIKQKNKVKKSVQTDTSEKKAVADSSVSTTAVTAKDSTHVDKKSKEVISKPNYGWVKYAVGVLLLLGLVYYLYRKYGSKFLI